jgi:NAD(P)-dependent dehydrogenase (short-subunit alcohol dehydrogenase family)
MMSQGRFHGKSVVVTGAGNGLGQASAQRLSEEGASVIVVDIDGVAAEKMASFLPNKAIAVQADIAVEADVERYMQAGLSTFGRIDFHHLNAGIVGTSVALPDIPVEDFQRVIDVNVLGPFLGLRAAFRQYAQQEGVGAIVVTASIASLTGSSDLLPYVTSKHGVVGLVHGGAMYGGPLGIRVNAVAPGIVPTSLFADTPAASGSVDEWTMRASTTPLRRAGSAAEIASIVAFLLSEDASYMTGQVVSADGGASIVNTLRPSGGAGAWDFHNVDAKLYGDEATH